jgi:hypothetical protein
MESILFFLFLLLFRHVQYSSAGWVGFNFYNDVLSCRNSPIGAIGSYLTFDQCSDGVKVTCSGGTFTAIVSDVYNFFSLFQVLCLERLTTIRSVLG